MRGPTHGGVGTGPNGGAAQGLRSLEGKAKPDQSHGFLHIGRTRSDAMESLAHEEGPIGASVSQPTSMAEDESAGEEPPQVEIRTICGIDERPFFPMALVGSLSLSAVCMLTEQRSFVDEMLGGSQSFLTVFGSLYVFTLACTAYTGLCNPGLMNREDYSRMQAGRMELPRRAHKTWLYKRPVLRFDHYCRWVTNVIGLHNHREFMLMCAGLVCIGCLGCLVDAVLLLYLLSQGKLFQLSIYAHLAYSVYFAKYALEIFRLHVGFVSRNELAKEWKNDDHYVVYDEETGAAVPVKDLDSDEYNEHFDANNFEYDETRNPWDRGWQSNCFAFWCNARWPADQRGEF